MDFKIPSLGVESANPIPKKPNQLLAVSNPVSETMITSAFDFQQRECHICNAQFFLLVSFSSLFYILFAYPLFEVNAAPR